MSNLRKYTSLLPAMVLIASAIACAPEADEDFLNCQGKCDSAGSLTLSTRWVPIGGSVRAQTGGSKLSVTPADGVELIERSGGRWVVTFSDPGYYTAQSGGSSLALRVADDGLAIELLSPQPGAFVTAGEGETLAVRGRIADSLSGTIGSPIVAGKPVTLDGNGEFQVSIPAEFGINTISIDAKDAAGNEFDVARSFLAAEKFSKEPASSFVQLDNEALAFISEALEPKLAVLLTEALAELAARTDSIGGADDDEIFVDAIQFPGIGGAPGSLTLSIETQNDGLLTAVLRTEGDTIANLNTGDGFLDFKVDITAKDLFAKITMDFGDFETLGPIVSDLALGFAPGQQSFDINVVNLPEFVENWFVDDQSTRDQIANGIKDAVAPQLSAVFTSFAGRIELAFDVLGNQQELALSYGVSNVRSVNQALQIDLAATFPDLQGSDSPGVPRR